MIDQSIKFEEIKQAVAQMRAKQEVELMGLKVKPSPYLKGTQTLVFTSKEAFLWDDICDKGSVTLIQLPDGPSMPEWGPSQFEYKSPEWLFSRAY
jgi:hypothetical protein